MSLQSCTQNYLKIICQDQQMKTKHDLHCGTWHHVACKTDTNISEVYCHHHQGTQEVAHSSKILPIQRITWCHIPDRKTAIWMLTATWTSNLSSKGWTHNMDKCSLRSNAVILSVQTSLILFRLNVMAIYGCLNQHNS